MWQKSSQTLETSIDALHSATFVGVGDFPTNATLLVNRRAADVAAEKQNVDLQLALSILNLKSGRAFFCFCAVPRKAATTRSRLTRYCHRQAC
jgi:hypothetical protein